MSGEARGGSARPRVGLVGLGAVGARLAGRLRERFDSLAVHDRDPERYSGLTDDRVTAVASPRELATRADLVVLSLPSPAAVEAVMTGENGLLAAAAGGLTVIDTSTVDPGCSRRMGGAAAEAGVAYLDAPITCAVTPGGGTAAAAAGALTFLLGGSSEHLERARPVLDALGRRVHHVGPVGSGSLMKLVTNQLSGIQTLAIAEALVLAAKAGFPAERTLEICADTVASSYVLEGVVRQRLRREPGPAQFSIDLMHKDHLLTATLAAELGAELPMNQVAITLCERMQAAGRGQHDNVAAVNYFAEMAGVDPFDPQSG